MIEARMGSSDGNDDIYLEGNIFQITADTLNLIGSMYYNFLRYGREQEAPQIFKHGMLESGMLQQTFAAVEHDFMEECHINNNMQNVCTPNEPQKNDYRFYNTPKLFGFEDYMKNKKKGE